jgi:pseudouridine-5'-phosphate glycosidase
MSITPAYPLEYSDEVMDALRQSKPVVVLESSVIAQGLPSPHNLQSALACEAAIRAEGAVPATIAVIDGEIRVGLSRAELERLAQGEGLLKLGERDLGYAMATRATGGTTVSATLAVARAAMVRVFSTGGIGGVHRGDDSDVSADLPALARYPVAVVCAGAKAILDLPRTLEVLETSSVPVVGLRTKEFPAFYSARSGLSLEQHVSSEQELARLCEAHWSLGMSSAVLAVQPCPSETALPAEELEAVIVAAVARAQKEKVRGKAVTPFLLKAVAEATHGRTLAANLALLENNARTAARLAKSLCGE